MIDLCQVEVRSNRFGSDGETLSVSFSRELCSDALTVREYFPKRHSRNRIEKLIHSGQLRNVSTYLFHDWIYLAYTRTDNE